jgi:hypothetical protein
VRRELDEKQLVRYLLGTASSEEEQQLEERYFSDDNYFELLMSVEDDLIDAYVRGELSGEDRQHFERRFLSSPQRRQRVVFAQTLLDTAAQRSHAEAPAVIGREKTSWWRVWPGSGQIPQPVLQGFVFAGFALLAVIGSVSITQTQRLRSQLAEVQTEGRNLKQQVEQQRTLAQQLSEALDQERIARDRLERGSSKSLQQTIAAFILRPGSSRSSEDERPLFIRPGTDLVKLQLDLGTVGNGQYRVAVRTADDQEVWSQDGLPTRRTAGGGAVDVSLPANVLVSGDYVLTLRIVTAHGDIEDVGQYVFRVIKR